MEIFVYVNGLFYDRVSGPSDHGGIVKLAEKLVANHPGWRCTNWITFNHAVCGLSVKLWISTDNPQEEVSEQKPQQKANCAICGRALTHPDSVARGIGPVCSGIPNRVFKRHRYGTFEILGHTCCIPQEQNQVYVLSFLKLFSLCCACKNFTPLATEVAHPKYTSQLGQPNHTDYKNTVRVWRVMGGVVDSVEDRAYGKCAAFKGLIVDGNQVVICPKMKKRNIHYLSDTSSVQLYTVKGDTLTVTGKDVWAWRKEQKAKKEQNYV